MSLDPQVAALLNQINSSNAPSLDTIPATAVRSQSDQAAHTLAGEAEPVQTVEDRQIAGPGGSISIRIYTPEGNGPFPVLAYFHGGGWVVGNLDTHDAACRAVANRAKCIIVAVDYRLSPEYKFPAAVEDSYAATCWVAQHTATFNGDPARIAVGGDSAGGNLATVVALIAREQGSPALVYQLLIYPITTYMPDTPSYIQNATGYFLTTDAMLWYWKQYLSSEAEGKHPYVSPLQAPDLSNLPPALIITAEYDPLRDEGEMYAQRLQEAGVPTQVIRYDGMIHGFFRMAGVIDRAQQAYTDVGVILKQVFTGHHSSGS